MQRVRRIDNRGLLAKPQRTPEGFLRAEAHTAKVGILEYDEPGGGVRRELVLPEDLFDPESIASAKLVPLTYRHPETLLTSATARAHQVGSVGENIRQDGDLLAASIMVTDADAVKGIEAGDQQMSWGYDCDLDPTPGTHAEFGAYEAVQRRRRYNHLAIVNSARAGNQARIRLDAAGNACDPFARGDTSMVASSQSPAAPTTSAEKPAMKIKIGKHHLDASDANQSIVQDAIDRELAESAQRADAADKAKADALVEADKQKKRADGIKARFAKVLASVHAKLDAMKARMMGCDECGGAGKVMDAGGAEAKCDYCDGAGSLRMHDAIKAMPVAGDGPHPDEDIEEIAEETDSGVPERESAAEEKLETIANPDHPKLDAAGRKQRLDARATARSAARQKRADSLERRAGRRAVERAALLATAAKHLDAEGAKAAEGKPDVEVRRAVVAALAPHLDGIDKMSAEQVALYFTSETKRADAAGHSAQPSEGDRLRAAMSAAPTTATPAAPARRVDADTLHQAAVEAKANAWQRKPPAASK